MTDPLTIERLAAMREAVMTEIETDVTRRGRALRRGAIAGLLGTCVIAVGSVTAVEVATTTSTTASSAESSAAGPAVASTGDQERAPQLESGAVADAPAASQIVTTGSAHVTVSATGSGSREVETAVDDLTAWLDRVGGQLDRREQTDAGEPRATLVLRLPDTRVDEAIEQMGEMGTVDAVQIDRTDVGVQVADQAARIESLKVSVKRLRDLLTQSADTADLLAVERELADRQAQLESLQAEQRALQNSVALSTLTVTVSAADASTIDDEAGDGFVDGLGHGWQALVASVVALSTFLGVAVPWLAVALVIWAAWWLVRRFRRADGPGDRPDGGARR